MDNKRIRKFSHDSYFKHLMEDKENVKDLIQATLPKKIVKHLKLDTLQKIDTQKVTADLKLTFADVAYRCKYKNNELTLTFIFEHKSTIAEMPHLQLLTYMVAMWRNEQKNNKKLTPIIPYVFYHGKRPWNKSSMESYFGELDKSLRAFIPNFDYILLETSKLSNAELRELFRRLPMQVGVFMLKNIFDAQDLIENFTLFLDGIVGSKNIDDLGDWLHSTLLYAMGYVQEKPQTIIQKMKELSPTLSQGFKSTFDMLLEEGIQKGRQEGIQEGIQKGIQKGKYERDIEVAKKMLSLGMEIDFIVEVTELSVEEIMRLKKELGK